MNIPLKIADDGLQTLLQRHGLTQVGDVMHMSYLDLMEVLGISEARCAALKTAAARLAVPQPLTAAQLYQAARAADESRVPCGLPGLDAALRGGLPPGAITEVVGPSGVGKTQLCMGAVLNAAAPRPWGRQTVVVYIDTEGKFSADRLAGMARARWMSSQDDPSSPLMSDAQLAGLMERVLLQHPTDAEQLMRCLHGLSGVVAARGVSLLVLDSVAALVRGSFEHGPGSKAAMRGRAELLGQAAGVLKTLGEANKMPVLVTNQVTARFTGAASVGHNVRPGMGPAAGRAVAPDLAAEGSVVAALGTAWAHSVNVRLLMERRGDARVLQLVKSPASGNVAMQCAITSMGLQQVQGVPTWQPMQGSVLDANMVNQRLDHAGYVEGHDVGEGDQPYF